MALTDSVSVLKAIEAAESLMGQVYFMSSEKFASQDSEASTFFYRLYIEEQKHASIVRYCIRLIKANPKELNAVQADLSALSAIHSAAKGVLRILDSLNLEQLLIQVISIEHTLDEAGQHLALASTNQELVKLFKGLTIDDHKLDLLRFGERKCGKTLLP